MCSFLFHAPGFFFLVKNSIAGFGVYVWIKINGYFSFSSYRRVYKERLGLPPKIVIGYQSHADTATKSGSTTKNRFVV